MYDDATTNLDTCALRTIFVYNDSYCCLFMLLKAGRGDISTPEPVIVDLFRSSGIDSHDDATTNLDTCALRTIFVYNDSYCCLFMLLKAGRGDISTPEPVIVDLFRSPEIDSQPRGIDS